MPRRMIDPSILTSESIAALGAEGTRHFLFLMMVADDEGRFDARPAVLMGRMYSLTPKISLRQVEQWTAMVQREDVIRLYTSGGKLYGYFPKWFDYQRLDKRRTSKLPPPPLDTDGRNRVGVTSHHESIGINDDDIVSRNPVAPDDHFSAGTETHGFSVPKRESGIESGNRESKAGIGSVDGSASAPEPPAQPVNPEPGELPPDEITEPDPEWLAQLKTIDGYPANPKNDQRLKDWAGKSGATVYLLDGVALQVKSKLIWVPPKRHWTYNGKPYADIRATYQNWVRRELERNGNGRLGKAINGTPKNGNGYDPGSSVWRILRAQEAADRAAEGIPDGP